jgi:hypothetical protein
MIIDQCMEENCISNTLEAAYLEKRDFYLNGFFLSFVLFNGPWLDIYDMGGWGGQRGWDFLHP